MIVKCVKCNCELQIGFNYPITMSCGKCGSIVFTFLEENTQTDTIVEDTSKVQIVRRKTPAKKA